MNKNGHLNKDSLREEEHKKNPIGILNDTSNQSQSGLPNTSGMTLRELGGMILLLGLGMVCYFVYSFFAK